MIKGVYCLLGLLLAGASLHAQYVYTINADSVKITNHCDTAELILENHTQDVAGFLFNKGKGRTEFRKAIIKLTDTSYLLGADTLLLAPALQANNGLTISGKDIVLGQSVAQSGNPAQLTAHREIPLNGFNIGFSGTGNLGIGTAAPDARLHIAMPTASGSVGVFHVQGVDTYAQAFVLQAPAAGYTGNIFQTWKAFGSLGGAMGAGVNFASNVPQYFNIINNNSESLVKIYNENIFTGPTLRFVIGRNGANTGQLFQVKGTASITGNAIFGDTINTPTGRVHIAAGTVAAGTAPIKLTPGTFLSTPEDGAIEYDGTHLYLTESSTRYKLSKTLTGQLTTNFGAASLTAFNSITTSLSVAGAQPGDVVTVSANSGAVNPPAIIITAYIVSAGTVTLQAYNAGNSTVALASDTYKVNVTR